LNAQLFVRGPQGVTLTEAGLKLRDYAVSMQRSADSIDRMVRESDAKPEGRVRLETPDGIGAFWIAPRLAAFQRINPHITLSIDGGFWKDYPVRDEVDITIQYDERKFGEHTVEPLCTIHFAPFATRRYLEMYGAPKTHQEMLSHRTVQLSSQQIQRETWDRKAEAVRTLSAYNIETNCSAFLIMSVLSDAGIAFMPTCAAAFIPNLVMLGDAPVSSPTLYMVYDPATARVARAKKIMTWLKDEVFDPRSNPWFREEFVHPNYFELNEALGSLEFCAPRE
jgi:DNA-binding transcriptional LysR family regulator